MLSITLCLVTGIKGMEEESACVVPQGIVKFIQSQKNGNDKLNQELHELAISGCGLLDALSIKLYLVYGADINSKDENGLTPRDKVRLNKHGNETIAQTMKALGGKGSDSIMREAL